MKIALSASAGGHLTELFMLLPKEIEKHKQIVLTEKTDRTEKMRTENPQRKMYFFKPLAYNPLAYILPLWKCIGIFRKENVKLVITTGAEVGLIAVIAGKLLRVKTIFIGIAGNPKTPSLDGKFAYFFSDHFLVQYPELAKSYGKKAKYVGGIL